MDIKNYLKYKISLIENQLNLLIPEKKVLHNELFRAARYALIGGGKRLRPILTLATVETMGGNSETALTPACSLEMIHTYSLIHDDLPCMDDDDFRRGKPSLHRVFPEGHAVLTGDFLLTYAFEVLVNDQYLTQSQKLELIRLLAKNSGADGMIAGQIMDLEAEGKQIDIETLRLIHKNKTGALITTAVEFGGIITNTPLLQMNILRKFGENIGLAFQIVDDILDVTESEQHGKNRASDDVNNKATYVALLGLEQSCELAFSLFDSAVSEIQKLPVDVSLLIDIAATIIKKIPKFMRELQNS